LLRALSPAKQQAVRGAAANAFISGFRAAMLVTALIAAVAAFATWQLQRPRQERASTRRDSESNRLSSEL